jgi:hypothetical protein
MALVILEIRHLADGQIIEELKSAARRAEIKLVEYYRKAATSKPVVMATVCDPRYKLDYFNWAIKNKVTIHDEEIQRNAWRMTCEEFTQYWEKRTGGKAVQSTSKVSTLQQPS